MKKFLTFGVSVVFACMALLASISLASAATITVGTTDCETIQKAINAADDGDTVLVPDGTYTGAENRNLDFGGKKITVTSENGPENCIIDCDGSGRGFYFYSGEGVDSVLNGFTIQNGDESLGGGILCDSSSPTITNCTITGNSANYGGGICCYSSSPTITNCTISENSAFFGGGICCAIDSSPTITNCTISENFLVDHDGRGGGICCIMASSPTITNCTITGNSANYGGGICCLSSSPTITNCTITGNSAGYDGGGILCTSSFPTITNCTITGNSAEDEGGGICCIMASSPTITNCILWNNTPEELRVTACSTPIVTYSDIQLPDLELYPGEGNINDDPLFDFADGSFLLSTGSPCIDTGITDEESDIDIPDYDKDGNLRDEYPDMGAYEYIIQSIGRYRHQTRIRDKSSEYQESRRPSCNHPWR